MVLVHDSQHFGCSCAQCMGVRVWKAATVDHPWRSKSTLVSASPREVQAPMPSIIRSDASREATCKRGSVAARDCISPRSSGGTISGRSLPPSPCARTRLTGTSPARPPRHHPLVPPAPLSSRNGRIHASSCMVASLGTAMPAGEGPPWIVQGHRGSSRATAAHCHRRHPRNSSTVPVGAMTRRGRHQAAPSVPRAAAGHVIGGSALLYAPGVGAVPAVGAVPGVPIPASASLPGTGLSPSSALLAFGLAGAPRSNPNSASRKTMPPGT